MPVKQTIPYHSGIFFITFTCFNWLPLIEKVNGYDIIYKWFDYLKSKGHFINGYVVMPNHIHIILSFVKTEQLINTIIGNGKRFMAYEIIKRLQQQEEKVLLAILQNNIEEKRIANNKLHNVWELSFDWKQCNSRKFIDQKLNYIHNNPCSGKWNLYNIPSAYIHSSARYYIEGEHATYKIKNIMEMEEVKFE